MQLITFALLFFTWKTTGEIMGESLLKVLLEQVSSAAQKIVVN